MRQRVNIQYSVAVDELASEVARLVKKADTLLQEAAADSPSCVTEDAETLWTIEYLEQIDNWRGTLAEIDHILNDTAGLVSAYIQHQVSPRKASEETDTSPGEFPQVPDGLEAIIEQFKQSPGHLGEPDEVTDSGPA